MAKFKGLKTKLYKNILGNEFNDTEINRVIGAASSEYYNLANHLNGIIEKLKGKNQKVIVDAVALKGDFLLEPKFKKVVKYCYEYKQTILTTHNTEKIAEYRGQIINLDSEYKFISNTKYSVDEIHTFIGKTLEKEAITFTETLSKSKTKNIDNDSIYNKINDLYYVFDNKENNKELSINIDDISYVCNEIGLKIKVKFDGRTYTCDKQIENNYFSSTTIENNSLRMRISGNDRNENVFADSDYFFEGIEGKVFAIYPNNEDNVEVYITKRYRDKNEIIIRRVDKEPFPVAPEKLSFEASTSNIDKQRKAFSYLCNKPNDMNKGLLKLAYGNSVFPNEPRMELKDNQYRFLTDISRDGTKQQRLFVEKALATKDFMLLSGPPGTGKTTCILELIFQILKAKPDARILLSASTHVAIDNVLERIVEEFNDLLCENNIFPIRLGNESNIVNNNKVKPYIYDVIKEEDEILAEIYLRSANLVCGTAMGINRYLNIYDSSIGFEKEKFDYLIIDEASKTTLQEYIVPASMCERHVLIGDVKQLAPYTDTFLLEVLLKSQKQMTAHKEKLFYYNFVLNYNKDRDNQIFVIDDESIVEELSLMDFPDYVFIYNADQIEYLFDNFNALITTKLYMEFSYFIPKLKRVITLEELPSKDNIRFSNDILSFVKETEKRREVSDNIIGSNWAKEVAWRYVRFYELRKMDDKYKKEIEWLIIDEKAPGLKSNIEKLGDISIPSVLIKLQEGISTINRIFSNRLETGFKKEELDSRFVELIYQHRMHPSISSYAEKSIYETNQFMSSSSVKTRINKLNLFRENSIFVNVHDSKLKKKDNEKEVREIVRIIETIIEKSKSISLNFTVGILTFYKSQQKLIREYLNRYLQRIDKEIFSEVVVDNVKIELYTVDKYQGREADITIVSLSRNSGLGFMNVPNRINVGLTRAKFYRIVVGDAEHFKKQKYKFLRNIVLESEIYKEGDLL